MAHPMLEELAAETHRLIARIAELEAERDMARRKLADYKVFFGESGRDQLALAAAEQEHARAQALESRLEAVRELVNETFGILNDPKWTPRFARSAAKQRIRRAIALLTETDE